VLVGNGRLYGGPFPFFKHAVIDDGLLDVIVFKSLGYLEIIKYLQDVVFSSEIRVPNAPLASGEPTIRTGGTRWRSGGQLSGGIRRARALTPRPRAGVVSACSGRIHHVR